MFRANPKPHFFKIILDDAIRDAKLKIPKQFVRKYGKELSSPIVLKVPIIGETWQVELLKSDGEMWLRKGWKEFMEYCSIAHGYFVVFELEKYSEFNVVIFDHSASEIDYPLGIINGDNGKHNPEIQLQEPKIEETENDESIDILDEDESPLASRSPSTRPRKKMKLEPILQFQARSGSGGVSSKKKMSNAFRKAKRFRSQNPFFIVEMRQSYVHDGTQMGISARFARKYFKNRHGDAILTDKNGGTWPVKYFKPGKSAARISDGWREFTNDNELEVGDVVVFELINRSDITMRIKIFRDTKDANSSPSLGNGKQLKNVAEFTSKKSALRSCYPVQRYRARYSG